MSKIMEEALDQYASLTDELVMRVKNWPPNPGARWLQEYIDLLRRRQQAACEAIGAFRESCGLPA